VAVGVERDSDVREERVAESVADGAESGEILGREACSGLDLDLPGRSAPSASIRKNETSVSIFTQPLIIGVAPAIAAAVGFGGIAAFQIALAAGAPLGHAAWGGSHAGQLPVGLRVGSGVAVAVWASAAGIVLGRAAVVSTPLPPTFLQWATWGLFGVTLSAR
jgi:hypothetical protein